VKRFEFGLARVRDFRRQQLQLEEAKLQKLLAERQELEAESARLECESAATRHSLMVTGSAEAQDLVAADRYLRHLATKRKAHTEKMAGWRERTRKQQKAIAEARQRVRMIEKLEEKQFQEWKARVDREQENLSSELYLARWNRNGG